MNNKITTIFTIALFGFLTINAQEDNILKTTEIRTIDVIENGEQVEKTVKVQTITEQDVVADPKYKDSLNQPRIFKPKKVEQIILIDNDDDTIFDKKTKINFSKNNGEIYNFTLNSNGFDIQNIKTNSDNASVKSTGLKNVYLVSKGDDIRIGYYKNGIFFVEFYDEDGLLVKEQFNKVK